MENDEGELECIRLAYGVGIAGTVLEVLLTRTCRKLRPQNQPGKPQVFLWCATSYIFPRRAGFELHGTSMRLFL